MGTTVNGVCAHLVLCPKRPALGTLSAVQNNLKSLRVSRGWSQDRAAAEMGTTRNQYVKLESGSRRLSDIWIDRAARAFKIDAGEVVSSLSTLIPIRALVGAGGLIDDDVSQVYRGDIVRVRIDVPLPDGLSAYEVWGDSMLPKYDPGDLLIVRDDPVPIDRVLGDIALVLTKEGTRYVKRVLRGSEPGLYTLESYNASRMEDVEIAEVGMIYLVLPARQVTLEHDEVPPPRRGPRKFKKVEAEAAE